MKLTKILDRLFVEEHQEIYDKIVLGDLDGAVEALQLLDEMGRTATMRELGSHIRVLLQHLIKRTVQKQPNNRSWNTSIRNSVREITLLNERKPGSYYFSDAELTGLLERSYDYALEDAADEIVTVFRKRYTPAQLANLLDKQTMLDEAFQSIINARLPRR